MQHQAAYATTDRGDHRTEQHYANIEQTIPYFSKSKQSDDYVTDF